MALDGAFLSCVRREMAVLRGTRVEKIHQPARDVLLFAFRGASGAFRVVFSAAGDASRVHLTAYSPENPAQPPMFCMLLRKYLLGAKLEDITQEGLERVLYFHFRGRDEMGDLTGYTLAAEVMGRWSNVVLIHENGKIIDSLRRVYSDTSRVRLVLPDLPYASPPRRERLNFLTCGEGAIREALKSCREMPLAKGLIELFEGISPIVAREWEFFAGRCEPVFLPLKDGETLDRLCYAISSASRRISDPAVCRYTVVRTKDHIPRDFSFLPIRQYGALMVTSEYESPGELLDAFFAQREHQRMMAQRSGNLLKTLETIDERVAKRVHNQREELLACDSMELDRRRGDLLSANLYRLQGGVSEVELEDFYAEGSPMTRIALDTRLTPAQNAQMYYKKYRKAQTARQKLTELIEAGEREREYIQSVMEAAVCAESEADLAEIRAELSEQGYLRQSWETVRQRKPQKPRHFRSEDGFDIYVGRNNRQNDLLTLKTAKKQDLWLHAHNIPGAHTIIVTNGQTPPDRTIEQAANLAARYSGGRERGNVPVDYCLVKYVKKPSGARPGMVIYTDYKTANVTPDEELAQRLRMEN